MEFLENPVFICGAPRSGTTLLSNLLDGHHNLIVFPVETHILQYFMIYRGKVREIFFLRDYLFTHDIRMYIDPSYREEFNRYLTIEYGAHAKLDLSDIDGETFIKTYTDFLRKNGVNLKTIYQSVALSLYRSLTSNGNMQPKWFVEKRPLDNEMFAPLLKKVFPRAKFIHILRDLRTRYASAKRRRIKRLKYCPPLNGEDFVRGHAKISMISFILAKRNKTLLGDDYLIVKYEDLTLRPKETMKNISSFLSLPWEDILTIQTVLGKKTTPISSFKTSANGVLVTDFDRLKAFNKITSKLERMIVNLCNKDVAQEFGYDLGYVRPIRILDLLLPIKYEHPFHYFKNRLFYLKEVVDKSSTEIVNKTFFSGFREIQKRYFSSRLNE